MEMKSNRWLELIKKMIWILFAAIIGYLLIASIFSTCYVGRLEYFTDLTTKATEINTEHTYYIRDSFIQHILVFAVFSVALLITKKRKIPVKFMTCFFLLAAGIIAAYIVLSGQYYPKFDQKSIIEIASALNEGDTSSFDVGAYLYKYPYQIGIILFYQLLSKLFGNNNFIAFELINVCFIILSYYVLSKITSFLFSKANGESSWQTSVVCCLFLPYLFYATFLYGTVIGLTFALLSFFLLLIYDEKRKKSYLLLSSICMAVAVVLKSNYQIFLIAEIIYLVFDGLHKAKENRRKFYGNLLFVAALIVFYILSGFAVNSYIKLINHNIVPKGVPMSTFVAIGLQDGKAAPGWHNNYDQAVSVKNGFDYELTSLEAQNEIRNIVKGYSEDMTTAISFFCKKVASQWNNPTFQSLWIQEDREGTDNLFWIMRGNGRYIYTMLMNLFQTWILSGVFIYSVTHVNKSKWKEILLPITFIGGFLFHLFWEAKSIYAMPFFLLLIPLCVCGFQAWKEILTEKWIEIKEEGWNSDTGRTLIKRVSIFLAGVLIVCCLSYTDLFAKMFARNEDTGIFNTYTQEMVNMDQHLLEQEEK